MEIRNCIAELLSEHDCVIIPGFGGFIGNYAPSRIDPVHHTFHPPTKKILFNVNLEHNDGLLATKIATSLGVSYADACRMLKNFVSECNDRLVAGESVTFPRVGQLFAGVEGNIQFEQNKTANLLAESYGLTSFISPPVAPQISLRKARRKETTEGRRQTRKFTFPRVMRWAAILALPLGLATVVGLIQYDRITGKSAGQQGIINSIFSRFSAASLFEKKNLPLHKQSYTVNEASLLPATGNAVETNAVPGQSEPSTIGEPVPSINSGFNADGKFAVIVGAFSMAENAQKLINQLKSQGVEAAIYDQSKGGLYRVTMGTFTRREEALKLLAEVQSTRYSDAWLLAK
jgi:cell division septation protein DedD/nucleoid DNA-binding protein